MLKGNGIFSDNGPFHVLLDAVGSDRSTYTTEANAFVARNFLLDEGIGEERRDSYDSIIDLSSITEFGTWKASHKAYLGRLVFAENHNGDDPPNILPDDPDETPETFLSINHARSPFSDSDLTIGLLRVVTVNSIAEIALGNTARDILSFSKEALQGKPDSKARLDGILESYSHRAQLRPVYAALWDDMEDLFGAQPEDDAPGWADALRDRLGLLHLNPLPGEEDIAILIFRYSVREISRNALGHRPLMAPTVLDGAFSAAFFPSPIDHACGYTVDLSPDNPVSVDRRRELLHPAMRWRADALFRVGHIHRPVPDDHLRMARGLHLIQLREKIGRPDYSEETDRDLL